MLTLAVKKCVQSIILLSSQLTPNKILGTNQYSTSHLELFDPLHARILFLLLFFDTNIFSMMFEFSNTTNPIPSQNGHGCVVSCVNSFIKKVKMHRAHDCGA